MSSYERIRQNDENFIYLTILRKCKYLNVQQKRQCYSNEHFFLLCNLVRNKKYREKTENNHFEYLVGAEYARRMGDDDAVAAVILVRTLTIHRFSFMSLYTQIHL